ncbi:MAG: pseudouridine-5'-phosphate glycosidase [Planctomycetota bacterium]|nr:pseudouridine-5'-phosphate glycosidase [Planctomycetota bacterium]
MNVLRRAGPRGVALETTLLLHGVPRERALGLARELGEVVRAGGGEPAIVGVLGGRAVAGLTEAELRTLLDAGDVPKVNASNLGVVMHRGGHGATTVSATMEIAAAAGLRVFATGGLGGLHRGDGSIDISADLGAFTRFPVAVVSSGVKGLLDVEGTRELLEALGVCVVGFRTDRFPAFYQRESGARVDARFDDEADLARFLRCELARTGRGVLVANPVPTEAEILPDEWRAWLAEAMNRAGGASGRDVTPRVLAGLHEVSGGRTLEANVALVRDNARLAGRLAAAWLG